jgi:hypothetical protein
MYDIKITLPLTLDEKVALNSLIENLQDDNNLRVNCEYPILLPLFQRIIDKCISANLINQIEL